METKLPSQHQSARDAFAFEVFKELCPHIPDHVVFIMQGNKSQTMEGVKRGWDACYAFLSEQATPLMHFELMTTKSEYENQRLMLAEYSALVDVAADKIKALEEKLAAAQERAAFYKCCALSGEVPTEEL